VTICNDDSSVANADAAADGAAGGALPGASLSFQPASVGRRPRGRPVGSRGAASIAGLGGAHRELLVVNPGRSIFKSAPAAASSSSSATPRKVHFGSDADGGAAKKARLQPTYGGDDDADSRSSCWQPKARVSSALTRISPACSSVVAAAAEAEGDGERQPIRIEDELNDDEADALVRNCDSQYPCESDR